MRVGEQLRFDVHAKLFASAPRPSSGSLRSPPSPRGRQGVHSAPRCVQKSQLSTSGRGKPLPYITTVGRGALKHSFAFSAKRNCSPTLISRLRRQLPPGEAMGCLRFAGAPGIRQHMLTSSLFTLTFSLKNIPRGGLRTFFLCERMSGTVALPSKFAWGD